MQNWEKTEDKRYSWLYANSYGPAPKRRVDKGMPGVLHWAGLKRDSKVVDAGCGWGLVNEICKDYVGCDVSKYVIDHNNNDKNLTGRFIHCSMTEMPKILGNERFDYLVSMDVMEHVWPDKVMQTLDALSRINADKFVFAISTRQSYFVDKDGNHLHMTIADINVWRKLLEICFIVEKSHKEQVLQRADFVCVSKNRHL
tara:strand:+ start:69875 stop:70471 length:597 start_codon:yes stop_codon:yes gene_type:complete